MTKRERSRFPHAAPSARCPNTRRGSDSGPARCDDPDCPVCPAKRALVAELSKLDEHELAEWCAPKLGALLDALAVALVRSDSPGPARQAPYIDRAGRPSMIFRSSKAHP